MTVALHRLIRQVGTLLTIVVLLVSPLAGSVRVSADDDGLGTAYITPDNLLAQIWGSISLVYTVGEAGLAEGGGLRVQFPKSYHKSALFPQVEDPAGRYYVSATASNPQASLSLQVVHEDIVPQDVDFQDYTTIITLEGEDLEAGDTITFVFGDTSAGGMGILASQSVARERVWVSVDTQGTGQYQMLSDLPLLETRGGQATYLRAIAPSVVRAGETVPLRIVALDRYDNNSSLYRGTVYITCDDSSAQYPADYTFTEADAGVRVVPVTLGSSGVHRFQISDGTRSVWSNPIEVVVGEPPVRLYWGDTHVHTDASPEGYGDAASELRYGREVSGLHFMGFLDHAGNATAPLTPEEWAEQTAVVEAAHVPGEFAPFCSYEWSVDQTLQGHRTVMYRSGQQPYFGAITYRTINELWDTLAANGTPALTLPHHMGMGSTASNTATSWEYANSTFQRSLEIYQVKGLWEYYDPSHPLSAESIHIYTSVPGPYYAQDAWAAGQRLGVIASSDEHWGRPGRTGYGLAAVYAGSLSREGVFDAIADRYTYGITGERIILHFEADGHRMGSEYSVSLPHSPQLEVRVYGTDTIDWVEVLKYDGEGYSVIHRESPGSRDHQFSLVDNDYSGDSMYYVRLRQVHQVAGRDVMAWSSPIWVDADGGPTPTPTSTDTTEPTPTDTETVEPTPTETETVEPTPTETETAEPTPTGTSEPVLYEHLSEGDDNSIRADGAMVPGQSFTPAQTHTISLVRLKLYRQGSPGLATVQVRAADSRGLPTGSALATGTLETSGITTTASGEWYSVNLTPAELQAGTQYVLTIDVPEGDAANRLFCRWDRTDPPYAGGTALYSWDGGVGWRTVATSDLVFEEWGGTGAVPTSTPTTEPTPTDTPTTEPTPTDTPTTEPTSTETVEPTPTETETVEPTPTETVEPTPTETETVEPTPTETETVEPTPTETETVEPTPTGTSELVLYEYLNEGDDGSIRADGAMVPGQSFTPVETHTVSQVRLKLQRQGSPGLATVAIRAAGANGMPTGDYLASGTLDTAGITTSAAGEWYTIEVSPAQLQAGSQYVLTVDVPDGDSTSRLYCRWDRTDPPYVGGTALYSWDGGAGWRAVATSNLMFEVWGLTATVPTATPTLEPTATATPTLEPTATPTPTLEPTPTDTPTAEPTATSTPEPTPTDTPTLEPTATEVPTEVPTETPTPEPTPSDTPTLEPTATEMPTEEPTPTETPTLEPTVTETPTEVPTETPTLEPTPTDTPTLEPTTTGG